MGAISKFIVKTFFNGMSATLSLIIINTVIFLLFSILLAFYPGIFPYLEIQPKLILDGQNLWTIVTSMFIHQSFFHLFVNMFTLFFLGGFVERLIGWKRFIGIYFVAGILGSLFFVFGAGIGNQFSWGPQVFGSLDDFAAGASGAVFGLLGILAVILPKHKVYLIVGPLIILISQFLLLPLIPEQAVSAFLILINVLMLVSIFAMFSPGKFRKFALPVEMPLWIAPIVAIVPLVLLSFVVKLPIGNTAHLGGLVAGLLYGAYLISKYPNKIIMVRRYFNR